MPRAISAGMVLEEVLLCIDQAFILGDPDSSSGGAKCDVPCLSSVRPSSSFSSSSSSSSSLAAAAAVPM